MRYISCFSGIGGLESESTPLQLCEIDSQCRVVLRRKFPDALIHDDIRSLRPVAADVVAGGWPCQDISVAGHQAGLSGVRSGLLYDLLRVSEESGASTLIAENVANLLRMRDGNEFASSLAAIHSAGFPYIAWRVLNAREFGLPQHRIRLLLVASKSRDVALTLFRELPAYSDEVFSPDKARQAAGFYWTAGTHSINYSRGYTPTVKVGSSLKIASPPALHYSDVVRPLTAVEALRLQGFGTGDFDGIGNSDLHKMAGNAVARPMGAWVFEGVEFLKMPESQVELLPRQVDLFGEEDMKFANAGLSDRGQVASAHLRKPARRALNLVDFIDLESELRLSRRAAAGLLRRLGRSQQEVPNQLLSALKAYEAEGDDGPED